MKKNKSYPLQLVKAFRAGEITRNQFISKFTLWQKSCGINYDRKGTADRGGVYMTYRGIKAAIRDGFFSWGNNTASTVFEFRRKVDFTKIEGAKWN